MPGSSSIGELPCPACATVLGRDSQIVHRPFLCPNCSVAITVRERGYKFLPLVFLGLTLFAALGLTATGLSGQLSSAIGVVFAIGSTVGLRKWLRARKAPEKYLALHEWRCSPDSARALAGLLVRAAATEDWTDSLDKQWKSLEPTLSPEKYDDSVVGEAIEVVSAFQVALRAGSVEWEGRKWNVDAMRSELVDIAKTLSSSSPDWHADTPEGAKRV